MSENIGLALLISGAVSLWIFSVDFVGKLGKLKGRGNCLWQALGVLLPGSPIITIPLLIFLPSKGVYQLDWRKLLTETLILGVSIFVVGGIVLFLALQFYIRN